MVRARVRIRILPGHQLESIETLSRVTVRGEQAVVIRKHLVEASGEVVVVDDLRRVCVERPFVDVGAVRCLSRIGREVLLHDGACCGVRR